MSSADPLTFDALEHFAAGAPDTAERAASPRSAARLSRIRPESDSAQAPDALPLRASRHVNAPRPAETLPTRPAEALPSRRAAALPSAPVRPEQAQFYRPELHSFWERFTGRRLVQILGWTALIAGTAALVAFAIVKFAA